jgi:predicted GIY-YIG superfamily endonuclease
MWWGILIIMHCVYLLQSLKDKSSYIGCTSDLKNRLSMHNQGKSFHTKKTYALEINIL